jgi:hypothetical protein
MRRAPHGRAARARAAGFALTVLVAGTAGCGADRASPTYPEVNGSVAEMDDLAGTTTTTTSRTGTTPPGTSFGGPATTTTRPGSATSTTPETKPPNPLYADYCRTFVAKFGEIQAIEDDDARLARVKEVLAELAALAPDPVKADLALFSAYTQGATNEDDLSPDHLPPDVKAADSRLDTWHNANCSFE